MAEHKPLVIIGGQIQQLPTGDTVTGATGGGGMSGEITGNMDGGTATTPYGGTVPVNGGGA